MAAWTRHFSFRETDLFGYVDDQGHDGPLQKVNLLKKSFETATRARFVTHWGSCRGSFGKGTREILSGGKRVCWKKRDGSFSTIPLVRVATETLQCHHGVDLFSKVKKRRKEAKEKKMKDDVDQYSAASKSRSCDTKKIGCPAGVHLNHILLFPDYEIHSQSSKQRKKKSQELRDRLAEGNFEEMNVTHRVFVTLPDPETSHEGHSLGNAMAAETSAMFEERPDARTPEDRLILSVGLLCADYILNVDSFPQEDSDQSFAMAEGERRSDVIMCVGLSCMDKHCFLKQYMTEDKGHTCDDQDWARGGNASNSCTVLSLLGTPCELLATIAVSPEQTFLEENLKKYGIRCENLVYKEDAKCPTSFCIINRENGSRTILHTNKHLPELTAQEFEQIDLKPYKWIHFEARPTTDQIKAMLQRIHNYNRTVGPEEMITTSVEIEKTREQMNILHDMAEYMFISKDYAMYRGCSCPEEAVNKFIKLARPGATVICAWGDRGASGMGPDGELVQVAAYSPEKLVNTLGAGDTFNSSVILALTQGRTLREALDFGCYVAGAKCGMQNFDGIKNLSHPFIKRQGNL